MALPWSGKGTWRVTLSIAGASKTINLSQSDLLEIFTLLTPREMAEVQTNPEGGKAGRLFTQAILRWMILKERE
jgi:hypothetical protein